MNLEGECNSVQVDGYCFMTACLANFVGKTSLNSPKQ